MSTPCRALVPRANQKALRSQTLEQGPRRDQAVERLLSDPACSDLRVRGPEEDFLDLSWIVKHLQCGDEFVPTWTKPNLFVKSLLFVD